MDDRAVEADLRARPLFDPDAGVAIAAPTGHGPGSWAGAPGAAVVDGVVLLAYRLRAPPPRRGHTVVVARSADGVRFEAIWQLARDDLSALSIERCAIVRVGGTWRVLASFVAEQDRRWRIEVLEGDRIERLDPRSRRPVLTADGVGVAAVKDPWLRLVEGTWYLFTSFGPLPAGSDPGLDTSGDALSTGLTGSFTGLATSGDGERWEWRGAVLGPSAGRWDGYTTRLTSAMRCGDGWVGLYDGSTVDGNYEERCGAAFSHDLVRWRKASADGPLVGTGERSRRRPIRRRGRAPGRRSPGVLRVDAARWLARAAHRAGTPAGPVADTHGIGVTRNVQRRAASDASQEASLISVSAAAVTALRGSGAARRWRRRRPG